MTPEERAQTLLHLLSMAQPEHHLGLATEAFQQAQAEDTGSWQSVGMPARLPDTPPQLFMIEGDRRLPLAQWMAEKAGPKPWPKTVQVGMTTMLVCPRCGALNIGNFCGICNDSFE